MGNTTTKPNWLNGNQDAYMLWSMVYNWDEETLRKHGYSEAFIESQGLEGTAEDLELLFM